MRPIKILAVDDEPEARRLIRDALSRDGYVVLEAENGLETVASLDAEPVDAVFMDIRMSRGDGLTALERIRALYPSLPVVMITGCGRNDMIEEAIRLGAVACLVKPSSIGDVVGMLDVLDADSQRNASG